MPIGNVYQITLVASIATALIGVLWELVYHALQQLRWDKDWPSLIGLLTGIAEAVPVWFVLRLLGILPSETTLFSAQLWLYVVYFSTTWLVVWLFSLGPINVFHLHWRFNGGSFSRRPPEALAAVVVTHIGMVLALVILWQVSR